jgi:sterol desaturase/sphingolipid hydroxylase (fatty acid hydroxylase superfamily)
VTIVRVVSNVVDRAVEARKARRRLYPVSILYTLFATAVLATALRTEPRLALLSFALGVAIWTGLEYYAHRFVLHGRFPDGPGLVEHFLHKYFDHLHWEHHKRPWDGNHINGTIADTLPITAPLALLGLLFPSWSLSSVVAGMVQAYIFEEWIHHSVHFYEFRGRYFRYIKRHHLYHHSPKGMNVAFGLTNGFWDIVFDTRIPADVRLALFREKRGERPAA